MADKEISALTAASAIDGTELVHIVQGGNSRKATIANMVYATGTFTPTIIGTSAAGTGTYSNQAGDYSKIGNVVFWRVRLTWSAHTGTGNMRIAGLPFTAAAGNSYPVNFYIVSGLTWSNTLIGAVGGGTTEVTLATVATGAGAVSLAMDTAADIVVSGFYLV